jgi:hypothetical protein
MTAFLTILLRLLCISPARNADLADINVVQPGHRGRRRRGNRGVTNGAHAQNV